MSRFRLLALDVDGTLVNSRDELTPVTIAALREAAGAGISVVLVTGRQYSRTWHLAKRLGLDTPVVSACGALIKSTAAHETLFRASFAPEALPGWLRVVDAAGYEPVVYTDHFHAGYEYHRAAEAPRGADLAEFVSLNVANGRVCERLLVAPPDDVFAGFAIGPRDAMIALHTELETRLPGQLYLHVIRSPRYRGWMCEILPAGVSKWSGILQVAGERGIDPAEICAVGDDVNDLPMIRGAGLGVAMGNGVAEVRAAADRIAPTNDEDGVTAVVRWLLDRR